MRCIICGCHVSPPEIRPNESGLFGNHVFIASGETINIFQSYCNIHLNEAKNFFSVIFDHKKIKAYSISDFSWTACNSSAIDKFTYINESNMLGIIYANQKCAYFYFDIDDKYFNNFLESNSKGKFINELKRQGHGSVKIEA